MLVKFIALRANSRIALVQTFVLFVSFVVKNS